MKKCLLGNDGLDERQLLLRGNVYKHSLIVLMALLLTDGFLKGEGIVWAEGMWGNILILWAGMGVELAVHHAWDMRAYTFGDGKYTHFRGARAPYRGRRAEHTGRRAHTGGGYDINLPAVHRKAAVEHMSQG